MDQARLVAASIPTTLFQQNFEFTAWVLNTVNALVVVLNPQGQIIHFNHACEQMTGYTTDEIRGRHIWDIIPSDQTKSLQQALKSCLAEKQPQQCECCWTKQDDSSRVIVWSVRTVLDSVETAEHLVCTGIDVTIQRQTEATIALQFQQALNFEAILKSITDRVRDSLDESQILQTAVQELGAALKVEGCDTGMYNPEYTTSTICYEYTPAMPSARGCSFKMAGANHIYAYLLRGEYLQFCDIKPPITRQIKKRFAILACPILDDQGVLGDLWLFKPSQETFNELEIRLVQQVANQCAIAIRQARLYQSVETQGEELANLIRLKDEFLSRVSHELRTPVSNMKMAIQMMAIALNQDRPFLAELSKPPTEQSKLAGYFRVLRDECEREISLLNDLLDLQRLDAGTHSTAFKMIDLQNWLPMIIDSFQKRTRSCQQRFETNIASNLPSLCSSPGSLERILRELLDNACKYTPPKEQITFKAWAELDRVKFEVANSGIEIPSNQLPRIFDRFYQIPTSDRWKQGGTGLGLALVQQLAKRLNGSITANSKAGQTCFTVELPIVSLEEGRGQF